MEEKSKGNLYFGGNTNKKLTPIHSFYPKVSTRPRSWNFFMSPLAANKAFKVNIPIIINAVDSADFHNQKIGIYPQLVKLHKEHKLNQFGELSLSTQDNKDVYWNDLLTSMMSVKPTICKYNYIKAKIRYAPFSESGVIEIIEHGPKIKRCYSFDEKQLKKYYLNQMTIK